MPVELPAELSAGEVAYYFNREGVRNAMLEKKLEPKDLVPFVRSGHWGGSSDPR